MLFKVNMIGALVIVLVLITAGGLAEEEKTDANGQWKYVLGSGGATITGYVEEPSGDLVIPGELDGHPVTGIGESAFADCMDLTDVTIPEGVTIIDVEAFYMCVSLASVIIPDSVTTIGEWAFKECGSLTSVTIGSSVTSIGGAAFFGCESLTNVTIPDNVMSIGSYAFAHCYSLISLIIPESIMDIGEGAFAHCEKLTLTVSRGSVAEQYAEENNIQYMIAAVAKANDDVFVLISGNTFNFLSGVGGWSTEVLVSEDGRFTGHFHDWDMGDTGDDYPEGTRYECLFTGVFVVVGKIDPFTYELRLTALNAKEDAGAERIEDGVRVISAGAYGLENGDVFMLYCPGKATADLPENFLDWIRMPNAWEEVPDALPFYGLYNTEEEFGFFSYAER